MHGLYLYGFFKGKPKEHPSCKGIDGINSLSSISYGELGALVSLVCLEEYGEEALEKNILDVAWIAPRCKAHEEIIESMMNFSALIPVKFCTIFKTEEKIREILKTQYGELRSLLNFLADKEEWGVKVFVRDLEPGEMAEDQNPEIEALDKQLSSASPGKAFFLKNKKRLLIREHIDNVLGRQADEIFDQLSLRTCCSSRNKLHDRGVTGREEEMISNAAFLVKKSTKKQFQARLDSLSRHYAKKGLIFEISGPWPPYNFCDTSLPLKQ